MYCQKIRLLAILAIALSTTTALADSANYWRWTSPDGTVDYGEMPPPNVKAERIHISTGTPEATAPAQATASPGATSTPKQATAGSTKTGTAGNAAATQKICTQAKSNLAVLQSSSLVRQTDENGKQRILTEDEKAKQIKLAKDLIKQYCK